MQSVPAHAQRGLHTPLRTDEPNTFAGGAGSGVLTVMECVLVAVTCAATALVEAFTTLNDNLVLPITAASVLLVAARLFGA